MTNELEPLKECPFQKEGETHELEWVDIGCLKWVRCKTCLAQGPSDADKQRAAELRNTRYKRTCGEYRGGVSSTPEGTFDDIEMWCERCDIVLDPDWLFCPSCGAEVVDGD